MLRKLLITNAIILFANVLLLAQSGALKGKLTDKETGDPIPFANVVVESGGQQVSGATTNFDGEFTVKPLSPGKYDLRVTYVGYQTKLITDIRISPDKISYQDVEMKSTMQQLETVDVVSYKVPLIEKDQTQQGGTVTSEEIDKMPGRDATSIASTIGGVITEDGSSDMNIRGARDEGTVIYIDGVKVRGSSNLPKSAVDQINVVHGGLPAKYGDATGGVVNITSKGFTKEFGAGVEIVTSEYLDNQGYNLVGFNIRGPLVKKELETRSETVVGFFIAGEARSIEDPRPSVVPYHKVRDDVLNNLEQEPLIENTAYYKTDLITNQDIVEIDRKQNGGVQGINLSGKIDIKPVNSNVNFTLGGSMDYSDESRYIRRNELFNSVNNPNIVENTMRGYFRFTHRFSNTSNRDQEEQPLIKNVYYSIQADYSTHTSVIQDPDHKDDFFSYGHVGKFDVDDMRNYTINRMDTFYNVNTPDGMVDTLVAREYYEFTGMMDTMVNFVPSTQNPVLSNYTQYYYETATKNYSNFGNIESLTAGGALRNGQTPDDVYGLWNSPGTIWNQYNKNDQDQVTVSINGSADIGDHAIQFGLNYDQQINRGYNINPVDLWTYMRQYTNGHISELDLENPILRFEETDVEGEYDTIVDYDYSFNPEAQNNFDKNLREKLGFPVSGFDVIQTDSYGPETYSMDMFSADELLRDGFSLVDYYGYDHTGEKLSSNPSFEDFFTEKNEDGVYTRAIGAYEPIYMAGYIQDKFAFEDIIFNVGVRVDRFDANQYVLKDPYTLFEPYTVDEVNTFDDQSYQHPANMGSDYVVYVNDYKNPSQILGYRDGDTWFNAQGTEIKDLTILQGSYFPYIKNPDQVDENPTAEAFEDYEPQTTIMPRIAFSFPISDEANFFAHYDVLSQRPSSNNRLNITDYYYLQQRAGNTINNPNLKTEKTIDYELGFQQRLSKSSALKLSAYYKEMRDQVQAFYHAAGFPVPYYSFKNQDFGTVKGFQLGYDLRRTGNIWLKTNYTLQFAEGTGSDATSGLNLLRNNQPNLRTILPLEFDRRHSINVIVDYRFSEGKKYNGPAIKRKKGDEVKSIPLLENTGMNVVVKATSGKPYSKSSEIRSIYVGQGERILEGSINGSRMPWTFRIDAKLDRDIKFKMGKKNAYFNVYVEVLNLLDAHNIQDVYEGTGDPEDDGFLNDSERQDFIVNQLSEQAFRDLYAVRMNTPYNYGFPRRIKVGLSFNF